MIITTQIGINVAKIFCLPLRSGVKRSKHEEMKSRERDRDRRKGEGHKLATLIITFHCLKTVQLVLHSLTCAITMVRYLGSRLGRISV